MSFEKQTIRYPIILLNSTFHFLSGMIIAHGFQHMATILTAQEFGVPVLLRYHGLSFPISDYSPLWTPDAIRLIFISGPAASFALGLAAAAFMKLIPHSRWGCRILTFWISIHAFNLAFGGIVSGILTGSGFGHFAKWIYLDETARFFIALVTVFILAFIGLLMTRRAMVTAPFIQCLFQENRSLFMIAQLLLPWILGSGLIILIKIPYNPVNDMLLLISLGVLVSIMIAHSTAYRAQEFEPFFAHENDSSEKEEGATFINTKPILSLSPHWIGMTISLLLLIVYRLVYAVGIAY